MTQGKNVTIMVIGETGAGKSANGNAMLEIDNAFEVSSKPNSCTFVTSAKSNTINGITRYYIDTQGMSPTDNLDAKHIQQMVEFLKKWELGVNAFFIILNIQNPRFDSGIQKMIRFINEFFNNPEFWNQTGIIFTRCLPRHFDRQIAENEYREKVVKYIKSLPKCQNLNPQLPCYFVNSVKWKTDNETKDEYIRAFAFALKFQPIPTQHLKCSFLDYKEVSEEIRNKKLIKIDTENRGNTTIRTFHYQDQKIKKMVLYNGETRYSEPEVIREYTEVETQNNEPMQQQQQQEPRIIETDDGPDCQIF